jgi:ATP-dependent Clp protease adaptor protein ClpS
MATPPSKTPRPRDPDLEGEVATEVKKKVERVKRYKVLFHNDDYTTMEFVVHVLQHFFHKTETEATYIMLSIHHKGHGVAGVYPRDVAETKVAQVMDFARENGMPLKVTAEPE